MKLASRVFFVQCAISSIAWSHEMSSQWSDPGRRTCGFKQPPLVQNVLLQRGALGAKRAAVDGMVGIAFHMHHLRRHVLGLVADGVDDDSAAHRTIGASAARLCGPRDFQRLRLRVERLHIEPEHRMPTAPAIPVLKNARLDSSIAAFQNKKFETALIYRRQTYALEKR